MYGDDLSELVDHEFYINHVVPFAFKEPDIAELVAELDNNVGTDNENGELSNYLSNIILIEPEMELRTERLEKANWLM
jgi:hypothetical protein